MHRPVLFNKTFTMKREELFEGAIVLAREFGYKKRSRHEIIEIYSTSVKLRSRIKGNSFFFASLTHIRPAKITPMSLKNLDFDWDLSICYSGRKGLCNQWKYPLDDEREVRVTLKEDCNLLGSTVIFCDGGTHRVSYIHEIQRFISNQQQDNDKTNRIIPRSNCGIR